MINCDHCVKKFKTQAGYSAHLANAHNTGPMSDTLEQRIREALGLQEVSCGCANDGMPSCAGCVAPRIARALEAALSGWPSYRSTDDVYDAFIAALSEETND